jgi:hypothetical protein
MQNHVGCVYRKQPKDREVEYAEGCDERRIAVWHLAIETVITLV